MNRIHISKLIALLIISFALASCSSNYGVIGCKCDTPPCKCSPGDEYPPPPSHLPYAGTRDILMANFIFIYENQDFDDYRDMLTRDYLMQLQASTIAEYPNFGDFLERDQDLRSHERLFSGDPVTNPQGGLVPGVSSISFEEFRQLGEWGKTDANHFVPDADSALFDVRVLFSRPGFSDLQVEGQIEFYVVSRDSLHEGIAKAYWQVAGMKDLTKADKLGVEVLEFGSLKGMFY